MTRAVASIVLVAVGALGLNGCVAVRSSHGYVLERGEAEIKVVPGKDTKESVLAKYGEPSSKAAFDDNSWYYIADQDSARAFFKPKTTLRAVVVVKFADNGTVVDARQLSAADGYTVHAIARTTPSRGKTVSVWDQLLGNVGKLPTTGGGGPGGPGGPDGGPGN